MPYTNYPSPYPAMPVPGYPPMMPAMPGYPYMPQAPAMQQPVQQQGICENRAAIADVKYTLANEGCQTRFADANNTRDIIDTIGTKVQGLYDKLCQLELDGTKRDYENRIAGMQTAYNAALADNQALRFAQSQTQQNGYIQQAITNGIDSLYNRLDSCPVGTVPVYGRQPIWTCSQNVAGGQSYGCPCSGYNAA